MTVIRLTLRAPRGRFFHWLPLLGTSLLLHLAVVLGLILLPRVFRPRMAVPDVYTVNLVSLPAAAPGPVAPSPPAANPPALAAAPAPAKARPTIKIPENPTARPAASKTPPKRVEPPKTKPEEPKPEPQVTHPDSPEESAPEEKSGTGTDTATGPVPGLSGGADGKGSGAGGVAGAGGLLDDATFQYGWYLSNMSSLFSRNWTRPIKPDLLRTLRAVVRFKIQKDGHLSDIVLEQPSGDAALDRSALRAVQDSNPLPPLPYQYGKDSLGVHFFFDLVPD